MHSRLRRCLKDQPIEVLQELKINPDEQDTVLQEACDAGRVELVLYFLSKGILPQQLNEQYANRYPLLAKILGACGAYQQPRDPIVNEAICFRACSQNETKLLQQVSQISYPNALLPLVLESKNTEALALLLDRKQEPQLPMDVYRCTPGFWTAIHHPECLNKVCLTTQDWLMTLAQLFDDKKDDAWEKAYDAAIAKDPALHQQFFDNDHEMGKDKLLLAASRGKSEELKKMNSSIEALSEAFMDAYHKKNYVALKTILSCCDQIQLVELLMQQGQEQGALFLLAGGQVNFFELAVRAKKLPEAVLQWCWTNDQVRNDFVRPVVRFSSVKEWYTQNRVHFLTKQVNVLDQLQSKLNEEIEAKTCCDDRVNLFNHWKAVTVFLMLVSSLGVYGVTQCTAGGNSISGREVGFWFSFIPTLGSMSCLLMIGIKLCENFKRGANRFQQLRLNQYSPSVQQAAHAVFDEFLEVPTDLLGMSLDNTVLQILPIVNRLLEEKRAQLKTFSVMVERNLDISGAGLVSSFGIYAPGQDQASDKEPLLRTYREHKRG